MSPPTDATIDLGEAQLARLCEEIAARLRRGEAIDLADYAKRWPQHTEELRQLLPAMQMMAGLKDERPAAAATASHEPLATAEALGDFRLVREIGRGGMGVVYEAEQLSLRRRVALKVLPFASVLDSRQLRRFQNEAQAAALLHHPHIVPVYGVGCERGVHYYAMQLVAGSTLADAIRELRRQAGRDETSPAAPPDGHAAAADNPVDPSAITAPADSLTPRPTPGEFSAAATPPQGLLSTVRSHRAPAFICAAVELGIHVAEALDYAHQEGVVHRDIKPGNLLLDERGKVWVTDFGLARVETEPALTLSGDLLGTLRYMSPEQALGHRVGIDGRTDVYSLGATLYELLTLEPVFAGGSRQSVLRQIAFEEPRPPRQLERGLPLELETILLKTLAKNADERYATAGALADDLRRFLEQKPILARRPSLLDRATKWALRNRSWVAAGAVGLLLALVTLSAASLLIWREQHKTRDALDVAAAERTKALAEKQRADEQAAITQAVNEFLQRDLLGLAGAEAQLEAKMEPDPELKLRTLLDRARSAVDTKFAEKPAVRAEIDNALARSFYGIGQYAIAARLFEDVREYRQKTLGNEHPLTLESMHNLAAAYLKAGQLEKGLRLFEQTLELRRRIFGPQHPGTLASMNGLAAAYQAISQPDKAVALWETALALQRQTLGPEHPETLNATNNLVGGYSDAGQLDKAVRLCEQTLELHRQVLGPEHPKTIRASCNLAAVYGAAHQIAKALPLFEDTLQLQRQILGPEHPDTLETMTMLAKTYQNNGQFDKAIPIATKALELQRKILGSEHPHTLESMVVLANGYLNAGRLEEALSLNQQVLEIKRETLGPEHAHTLASMNHLALVYEALHQYEQAIELNRQALELMQKVWPRTHPNTLATMNNLATSYMSAGQPDNAIELLEELLPLEKERHSTSHDSTLAVMNNLARAYQENGQLERSLSLYEQTLQLMKQEIGPEHPTSLICMSNLAKAYRDAGQLDKAVPLLEQTMVLRSKVLGPQHPDTLTTMQNLAMAYVEAGQFSKAVPQCEQTLQLQRKTLGEEHPNTLATMNRLAVSYENSGQLDKAMPIFSQTFELRSKALGPNHPDTLISMNRLAVGYWKSKQLDKSIPLFEDLLKRQELNFGRNHPDTLGTLANLGVNYRDAGRLAEALPLLEEAYWASRNNPTLAWVAKQLADAYVKEGKLAEAADLVKEQFESARAVLPKDSPELAAALAQTGLMLLQVRAWADAETLLRECLAMREQQAPDEWSTFNTKSMLGGALFGQQKYTEAEPLLTQGYEGMKQREEQIPGAGKVRLTEALERLVKLYEASGQPEDAARWRAQLEAARSEQHTSADKDAER